MAIDFGVGAISEAPGGRHWDRAEVRRQVARRSRAYRERGLSPGDTVLILFGNRLEFFAELLAIWRLGGCVIPVDSRLTPFEVTRLVDASAARFAVTDDMSSPATVSALSGLTVLHTLDCGDDDSDPAPSGARPRLDDDALVLFTSGSTGEPKGVVHTHRTLAARWITLRQCLGLAAYRRTLCLLPTHFGHGLICNCLFPWLAGCHLVVAPPFQPALLVNLGRLIDEHEITFLSSVPSMWSLALTASNPPANRTLRRVHVGSAPLSAHVWERIQQWAGIQEVFNAYGITEAASWVAGTTGDEVVPESGLTGPPWGATIRILHARSTASAITPELECAPGDQGMIWLSTPALMRGYLGRDDLTEAVVRQGWFMTGDLGTIDDRGRLFLRGRERDEINKGGMKIYPADIDEIVGRFGATEDVCAFRLDDERYGENVGMALVLKGEGTNAVPPLYRWLEAHLAAYKHPARWYLLDEMPRTSRGKINRDAVRRLCLSQTPLDLAGMLRATDSK